MVFLFFFFSWKKSPMKAKVLRAHRRHAGPQYFPHIILLNVPSNGGQSPSYCSGQEEIRDQEGGAPSDEIIPPPTGRALRLVSYSHILRGRTGASPRRPV